MQTKINKQIIQRLWDELVNGGRMDVVDELIGAGFVDRTPLPGMPEGVEGLRQRLFLVHSAFPDFRSTILELVAEGDRVVALVSETGTHQREFLGAPPTGRRWTILQLHLFRLEQGKVIEHYGVVDYLDFLAQLGLVRAPWQAAAPQGIAPPAILPANVLASSPAPAGA